MKCCPQWSNIRILPISRKYPVCIIKITNYIFSTKAGDVAVDDFSGNLFYTVGKIGQGPTEAAAPTGFSVLPNGNVALLDGGNLSLKIYNESGFVTSYDVPSGSDNRFLPKETKLI